MKKLLFAGLGVVATCGLFVGPASAASSSSSIQCTTTQKGQTFDNLEVPAGATCHLIDVTVRHDVKVGAGASFYTMDSTLAHDVTSQNAHVVKLIETSLLHDVTITGTTGIATIGSKGCQVDPIIAHDLTLLSNHKVAVCDMNVDHDLKVTGTTYRVGLFNNTIGHDFRATGNSGKALRIFDQHVTHDMSCAGNTANKIVFKRNTAGHSMDQCS